MDWWIAIIFAMMLMLLSLVLTWTGTDKVASTAEVTGAVGGALAVLVLLVDDVGTKIIAAINEKK